MKWIPITALAIGSLIFAGAASASSSPPLVSGAGLGWKDPRAPGQIAEYVRRIERVTGDWPGLAEYLVAVAQWESRGVSDAEYAGTWGWFQIAPSTAGAPPADLIQPPRAVAHAVDLIFRLRKYSDRPMTWLAVRRGWKYPSLVSDYSERNPESRKIRRRFLTVLRWLGIPSSFAGQRAIPATVRRPSLEVLIGAAMGGADA